MTTIEKSIEVGAPLSSVYNQWTQFESFPSFMEGVKSVKQIDDQRLHWVAEIGGVEREWDAQITHQIPDQKIAWKSTSGAENGGVVRFERLAEGRTNVMLEVSFEPRGLVENIGDALGLVSLRVAGDLKRFKAFIEGRKRATGAWRGKIETDKSDPAKQMQKRKLASKKPNDPDTLLRLLKKDHARVKKLFKDFDKQRDRHEQAGIASLLLDDLIVHAKAEEQIVYPALLQHIEDESIVREASEEHHAAEILIGELLTLVVTSDAKLAPKMTVLREIVKHHIDEEEGTMFDAVKQEELDFSALAQQFVQCKGELEGDVEQLREALRAKSIDGKQSARSGGAAKGRTTRSQIARARTISPRSRGL